MVVKFHFMCILNNLFLFLQCSSDSQLDTLLEEADKIQTSKNGFRKVKVSILLKAHTEDPR